MKAKTFCSHEFFFTRKKKKKIVHPIYICICTMVYSFLVTSLMPDSGHTLFCNLIVDLSSCPCCVNFQVEPNSSGSIILYSHCMIYDSSSHGHYEWFAFRICILLLSEIKVFHLLTKYLNCFEFASFLWK